MLHFQGKLSTLIEKMTPTYQFVRRHIPMNVLLIDGHQIMFLCGVCDL